MASCNNNLDDEEPTENLQAMFSDKKYKECYGLYKDADEALNSSGLDTLERLTLQYHVMKDTPITIAEVLQRRMEGLKEGQRELRVYIAGEIAVGKTTFLNLLMGGNYLPTGHGSCTNVLCEVYNNPVRLGVITYDTKPSTCTEIHLNPDSTSEEWRRLQNCIRDKKDNEQNVSKVQIYWPMEIFKSFQQTEPKEVTRQTSGSIEMGSDSVGMVRGKLPIVFMDFPGIDPDHEELFRPYLQHLDKCHTFIFIIDVHRDHGVHGPTLLKLMSDMTNATALESSTLDPESALFICTGCPETLLENQEKMTQLTEKVLKRIQMCWPMVVKNQIAFMKDQDQINKDLTDLLHLQNELVNFLVKSERLLLEEHCMWLTKLLECTSAYFKFGNKWKSLEDISRVDRRMRESIENLILFHDCLTNNSNTIKRIRDIQKNYEDKIRRYLDVEINSDELTLSDIISLRDRVGAGLMSFQEACDREIEMVLDEQKIRFQNTFMHRQIQTPENRNESYLLFMNILSISLMAVFLWPIGLSIAALAIFEFVSSVSEGDIISKQSLIKKILTKIQESIDSKLNKCLHEIDRQRKDLIDILNQNQRNKIKKIGKDRIDQSQKFDEIAKRLWDVYVGYIMKHEFSSNEIDVHYGKSVAGYYGTCRCVYEASRQTQKLIVKEIQTKLIDKESADTGIEKVDAVASLPYDSSIYRERYLLRHLSMKKGDDDYNYFVQYEGSARRVDKGHFYLQLFMKPYESSLLDIVKRGNLTEEQKKKYARSAARGLRFVHKHQVMHRDIKLSNYLIDDGDHCVICDVGHSKHIDGVMTIKGRRTPLYWAPEVRDLSHPHSTASDIYSFGLLLWELWNGRLIESEGFIAQNIIRPARDEFHGLVQACINRNPKQRPTIFDIVVRLDKLFS